MCRILYILNQRHVKKLLMDFLQQSDHISKYTPGLNSSSDSITHPDGFGLAYFHSLTHSWKVFKTPKQYRQVRNLSDHLNNISVSPIIIGHIRKQSGEIAQPSLENTHPFSYKNQLFVHNGCLPNFEYFSQTDKKKWVSKGLFPNIKGQTDSEWMFYVLLTVFDTYEHSTNVSMEEIIILCIQEWLNVLKRLFPYFNANVIYANKSHTIITRYRYDMPNSGIQSQSAPSLYIHNGDANKVLISSEPLSNNYSLVPENTIILISHLEGIAKKQVPIIMESLH